MTTKYNSLVNILNEKQTVSGIRKQDVRSSLTQLLSNKRTTTGFSCKGKKSIWTSEVSEILTRLGIQHTCGNDAPRGGACGEYVEVTSRAFLKIANKKHEEEMAEWKKAHDEFLAQQAEFKQKKETLMTAINENENIKTEYYQELSSRLNNELSGNARRSNRKHARKAASKIIANRYGLDAETIYSIL